MTNLYMAIFNAFVFGAMVGAALFFPQEKEGTLYYSLIAICILNAGIMAFNIWAGRKRITEEVGYWAMKASSK